MKGRRKDMKARFLKQGEETKVTKRRRGGADKRSSKY